MIAEWINTPCEMIEEVSKEESWCEGVVSTSLGVWSADKNLEAIWSLAKSFGKDYDESLMDVFEVFDPDRFEALHERGGRDRRKPDDPFAKPKSKSSFDKAKPALIGASTRICRERDSENMGSGTTCACALRDL